MQQDPNYGTPREEPRLTRVPVGGGMSAEDERTWSMLAHLSILLSLITGIGGPLAALIIWLVYKDKSQRVAFHALQSLWYQLAWIVILAVGWTITGILIATIILAVIGIPLALVMLLATFIPFVHQCYAAYKVYQGVDYRYPVVADMIDGGRRAF
jgi:uncharacterized Tic20 family protein